MKAVGLMPSDNGHPGGRITGQHISDYVIENGKFHEACNKLLSAEGYKFSWVDRMAVPKLFERRMFKKPAHELTEANENEPTPASNNVEVLSRNQSSQVLEMPWAHDPDEQTLGQLMPANFVVQEVGKKPTRYRYQCPGCSTKIYGKPRLNILCMD